MDDESSDFVTIDEIMEKLNVGRNTVYALLKNKQIEALELGVYGKSHIALWKNSLKKILQKNQEF